GQQPAAPPGERLRFGGWDRIGPPRVAWVEDDDLHGLAGAVEVVVPPAAVVHEGLPGRVVLRARDADGTRLVLAGEDAVDHVDEGGNAELMPAAVSARLDFELRARDQNRRVDGGTESTERSDEVSCLETFGRLGVGLLGAGRRRECDDDRERETEREPDDHGPPPERVELSRVGTASAAQS